MSITANGINWAFALATSIAFAFLGLLVPNLYKQTMHPRAHNRHKFLNEFLASHQLTYITFFAAVVMTADFKPGYEWVKKLFALGLAFAFGSYLISVYFTVHHDKVFVHHGCVDLGHCSRPISVLEILTICNVSLTTSLLLIGMTIALVCIIE